ncbi:UNVERIFIED_ORG: hypothetical protein BTE55_06880 [Rhizobium sophorae]|nr:periplasmic binding fold domain-containing protein [Rhizobium sp. Kim5]
MISACTFLPFGKQRLNAWDGPADAERQIPRLIAGKFDAIICSMSATAKPEEIIAFSDSYRIKLR